MVLMMLCHVRDINNYTRENTFAHIRYTSIPYTVKTSRHGRAIKEFVLVVCRTFDPVVTHTYQQGLVQTYTNITPCGVSCPCKFFFSGDD